MFTKPCKIFPIFRNMNLTWKISRASRNSQQTLMTTTTTTTTTPQLIQSVPCKESGCNMLRLPLRNNPPVQVKIRTYHSGDIKSPLGRFRNQLPLEAEEYLAHTRLSVTSAQVKVSIANNKAIQQRFQEYRLLLDIGEKGGDINQLDPVTAFALARLARETLASEYDLAVSKFNACQQELVVLRDAVDESLVFLTDADHQMGQILNILNDAHITIPKHPIPVSSSNPTYERPDNLFVCPVEEEEQSSDSQDSFGSCDSGGGSPSNHAQSTTLPY